MVKIKFWFAVFSLFGGDFDGEDQKITFHALSKDPLQKHRCTPLKRQDLASVSTFSNFLKNFHKIKQNFFIFTDSGQQEHFSYTKKSKRLSGRVFLIWPKCMVRNCKVEVLQNWNLFCNEGSENYRVKAIQIRANFYFNYGNR